MFTLNILQILREEKASLTSRLLHLKVVYVICFVLQWRRAQHKVILKKCVELEGGLARTFERV